MEQHSVPQNIASFNFKLFGNLTVRQFFTLIIPLSAAALVYFSPMPSLIRIPIALAVSIFGFFIALVPINGMPFDKWAIAFIKAIMSPTQRIWIKESKIPDFISIITAPPEVKQEIPEELSPQKKEKLLAYIKTLPKENATPLDIREETALAGINFSEELLPFFAKIAGALAEKLPPPIIWPEQPTAPPILTETGKGTSQQTKKVEASPKTTIKLSDISLPKAQIPHFEDISPRKAPFSIYIPTNKPKIAPHAKPFIVKGLENRLSNKQQEDEYVSLINLPSVNLASDTNYTTDNIISVSTPDGIKLVHGIGTTRARKLHFAPPLNFDISKLPVRGEKRFEISNELKRKYNFDSFSPEVQLPIEKKSRPLPHVSGQKVKDPILNVPQKTMPIPKKGQQVRISQQPQNENIKTQEYKFSVTDLKKQEPKGPGFSQASIIPLTQTPNVISGQVTDASGNPVSGAVLVVRDSQGIPIRALKTNKLGQFLSATPLANGTYNVETESELAEFNPLVFTLKGKVLNPIAIIAEGMPSG